MRMSISQISRKATYGGESRRLRPLKCYWPALVPPRRTLVLPPPGMIGGEEERPLPPVPPAEILASPLSEAQPVFWGAAVATKSVPPLTVFHIWWMVLKWLTREKWFFMSVPRTISMTSCRRGVGETVEITASGKRQ